tara:strand:- start:43 stop:2184 length:2142 start_codon:yes stop_codon:yes gene_type:complete
MVDWTKVTPNDDREPPYFSAAPSREEVAATQREKERTLAGIELGVNPLGLLVPSDMGDSAAMLGTGLALLNPASRAITLPMKLFSKAPKAVKPFLPSLIGSTEGAILGVSAEQALQGKFATTETGKKILGTVIRNAAYDVGGNLAFALGGKTLQIGSSTLQKLGIKKSPLAGDGEAARVAAQELLSKHGATLTKGQLTGKESLQEMESLLESSSASNVFSERNNNFFKAINAEAMDIQGALAVSPDFKQVLTQGRDPTQLAVGDRWQNVIKTAEVEMKSSLEPVYKEMQLNGDGFILDMKGMKQAAKQEWDQLSKSKFAGASADKKEVLEQILKQDDVIDFSTAHDLRSAWLTSSRESAKEGVPTTALTAAYSKAAKAMGNQMDRVAVITFGNAEQKELARSLGLRGGIDSKAGIRSGQYRTDSVDELAKMNLPVTEATISNNPLLSRYFNAQKSYKAGLEGFYSDTMAAAIKASPSDVGSILFNTAKPERLRDVNKALVQAEKYSPGSAKGLRQELQYGYLDQMFKSTDDLLNFAKKLKEDKEFSKTFNYLFTDPTTRKQVQELANAINVGLPPSASGSIIRNKAITAGTLLGVGGISYLTLSDEARTNIDLGRLGLQAGLIYFTPKLLARSLTNKNAMDALAKIATAPKNPRFAGAITAKALQTLQDAGILDSEYLKEVDEMLYGNPAERQQATPQTNYSVDWSTVQPNDK